MIMEDDGNNGHDDGDEYGDQYGTMIMGNDDDTHNNNHHGDDDDGYNSYGNDDDEDQYGTMILQKDDIKESESKTIQHDNLVSIFDGQQALINSVMKLPDDPSKQELLNINETLKQLFAYDQQKLQDYYQANIALVQKRIKKMD